MTEGSMTGQPYGGVNERPDSGPLPGEKPMDDDEQQVQADPDQSPRAAQGGMSDDVTHVPGGGAEPGAESRKPGTADATGPQG